MNRRTVLAAVGSSVSLVAGCFSADDDRSDASPSVPSAPEIESADRSRIVACERDRVRETYFEGDRLPDDVTPEITMAGSIGEYARLDVETEWGDRPTRSAITISATDSPGIDGVPSSSADAFADLEPFQSALSEAIDSGSSEIAADNEEYEAIVEAIEAEFARFETGDSVYLEHDGELVRLLSTESRADPPQHVQATYYLSESELRRDTSDDPSPDGATPVDC